MNRAPKFPAIAEAAIPKWESAPLIGWSPTSALFLCEAANLHLVIQIRNRDAIIRTGWTEGMDFTATLDVEFYRCNPYRIETPSNNDE